MQERSMIGPFKMFIWTNESLINNLFL